jgi:hypothetical protein
VVRSVERMASTSGSASRRWLDACGRAAARFLLGPRDTWLPALALVLPAVLWLSLEGRAYPPFERYQIGDFAKIQLYTRLAAEGSQRVGTESRFHIHQPGPGFFYAVAPVYVIMGGTTRAMAVASLAWNLVFLLALLREAGRLAPGTGPFVAAFLLAVFLQSRGLGVLASSWNPHVAMLPFGVALLVSARLATGQGRALPLLVLAASLVLQCQVAWMVGVLLPAAAGLAMALLPAARRALGIPTRGPGLTRGSVAAAALIACTLWALPVVDEFTGEYRNFHRMLAMRQAPRSPTPWTATLRPGAEALNLRRDGLAPESAFAWGARNLSYDPRLPGSAARAGLRARLDLDTVEAVLVAVSLLACGWLAARRRAPTVALGWVAAVGMAAVPLVVRYVPGRTFPSYLFMWGSMVTLAALLVVGTELLARAPGVRSRRGLAAASLLALPVILVADALRSQPAVNAPRDPRSIAIESLTKQIKAQAAADVPGRRFLLRVAPHEDPSTPLGLILALDKAGLRFGVEPFGSCRIEGRFTPRGDEWAELLVGDLPASEGARWLGSLDGPTVVWQVPWRRAPASTPRS